MGRKHRSSSFGNNSSLNNSSSNAPSLSNATTFQQTLSQQQQQQQSRQQQVDVSLAASSITTLINHFVLNNSTAFHDIVTAASSLQNENGNNNDKNKDDALYLLEGLCNKLHELDNTSIIAYSQPSSLLLQKLLTCQNYESGYTSLHTAIYNRDLFVILLLLWHATAHYCGDDTNNNNNSSSSIVHPLQLLNSSVATQEHYNANSTTATNKNEGTPSQKSIMNIILTSTTDYENLTPIQLLGKVSIRGLELCRTSLSTARNNDRVGVWTVRGERRICSDSFNVNNLDETESDDVEDEGADERRVRSNSFNVHLNNDDSEDEEGEESSSSDERSVDNNNAERGGGVAHAMRHGGRGGANNNNNDLIPLDDNVDFNVLDNNNGSNNNSNNNDVSNQQEQSQQAKSLLSTETEDEYGCEVLTFGRADSCALGVPTFTTTSSTRNSSNNSSSIDKNDFASSNNSTSYKPKRVELFALGELQRGWSSSSSSSSSSNKHSNVVDSPAVSIAASTHHTLVSTASGQLYSFGYGKSGRLGTGDENHRPLPTRILGSLTNRIVLTIAAATNHSLCSTNCGRVYSWGSNGHCQLGYPTSSSGGRDNDTDGCSRLSPRRVESGDIKSSFVVAVAAGDRHSVVLTKLGEVYCWGDNRSGQLGQYMSGSAASGGSSLSSPSSTSNRCNHRPQRVEGLWSAQPHLRAIAVSASEFSTLVLTLPPTSESSTLARLNNTVYSWGHGNHTVTRVIFPTDTNALTSTRRGNNNNIYSRSACINPIAIASAKYHNVAITKDGRVYTWGLHAESLGIEKTSAKSSKKNDGEWTTASDDKRRPRSNSLQGSSGNSSSSSTISSPQLVVGMLPENGGGKAVAVSASENHTAIVTSEGHCFTWGNSIGTDSLGHKGVRWQQCPRKVQRVHRAVGVAAAKEHTVLLMATTFPPLPTRSLLDNEGYQPLSLQEQAAISISKNVDLFNVLPISATARRLNCKPLIDFTDIFIRNNLDGVLAVGNKNDFTKFLASGRMSLAGGISNYDREGRWHPFLYSLVNNKRWIDDSRDLLRQYAGSMMPVSKRMAKKRMKREEKQHAPPSVRKESEAGKTANSSEPSVDAVKKKPCIAAANNDSHTKAPRKLFKEESAKIKSKGPAPSKYRCEVCNVSCPDNDSYQLHMNGRKHRNKLAHARKKEENDVAESMMAIKQMQLMDRSCSGNIKARDHVATAKNSVSVWAIKAPVNAGTPKKTSSERKARSKSFQDILLEEQERSPNVTKAKGKLPSPFATKQSPVLRSSSAAATAHHVHTPPTIGYSSQTSPGSASALPLSAFMKTSSGGNHVNAISNIGASWGTKPSPTGGSTSGVSWNVKPARSTSSLPQSTLKKSFSQIQQEEENRIVKEDRMCRIDGNQWFVQQRERAASIGEIAEQEKKNREMQELIEQQRQIEQAEEEQLAEAIARSLTEQGAKKQHKKKRQGRQKKSTKSNTKT